MHLAGGMFGWWLKNILYILFFVYLLAQHGNWARAAVLHPWCQTLEDHHLPPGRPPIALRGGGECPDFVWSTWDIAFE